MTGDSERVPWLALLVVFTIVFGVIIYALHQKQRTEPLEPRQTIPVVR
ncbi:MAG: hypothetical protein ACXVEF_43665 [Polyangiales bacterium]